MEQVKVATGVEWSLEDCAIVKFIIPPLQLNDGRLVRLRDAHAVFPPIRMLLTIDGEQIKAQYHPTKGEWELVDD